jgi:hypothetical protein
MNANARKRAAGRLVALVLAGVGAASSTTASAQYYHRYYRGYARPAGLGLAGVAAGATVGTEAPPLLAAPYAYAPGPRCHMAQVPAYDEWGRFAGYGPIQICG